MVKRGVTRLSMMKIHAQPGRPPIPSILSMAAERRQPKEQETAAAEKKMAQVY
jgi:hypothetical protein